MFKAHIPSVVEDLQKISASIPSYLQADGVCEPLWKTIILQWEKVRSTCLVFPLGSKDCAAQYY